MEQLSIFELYDEHQYEIDRESIRWYIHAVHTKDAQYNTFVVWAEKPHVKEDGTSAFWKQHGYRWTELLAHVRKMSATAQKDIYLSLQSFCAPFRRAETLFGLNAIAFDIDVHNQDESLETTQQTLFRLHRDVFETAVLPEPSMIIASGRGLQVVYLLDYLPKQGLSLWRLVGDAMAERIRSCFSDYPHMDVQLDGNYMDVTRVLRLPGTYNTAAHRYAQVVIPADLCSEPVRYRLDSLRDMYLPELVPHPKGIRAPKKGDKGARVSYLYNAYSLHAARLSDLVTLVELRQGHAIKVDGRKRMVFLYRYWSCFCTGQDGALEAALSFNACFLEPLPERAVKQNTLSAEKAYKLWQEDNKKGYNYRNTTLIRLLEITEEEQIHLTTIISHDEKMRRFKLKNWGNDKRNESRKVNEKKRNDEIIKLLEDGYSLRSVAAKTEVARRVIIGIAQESGFDAEARREQRDGGVVEMLKQGFSYRFISDALCISKRTIGIIAKKNGIHRKQGERMDIK